MITEPFFFVSFAFFVLHFRLRDLRPHAAFAPRPRPLILRIRASSHI